ncbi:MAG TPA: hypothetical protein VMF70_02605 [Gemmatimonadales bacterium]|nr:hypothetical protein [Gemmatimonadales bacterium]
MSIRAGKVVMFGTAALALAGCSTVRSAMGGAMGGVNTGVSNAAGNAVAGQFRGPSVPGAPAGGAGGAGMSGPQSAQMMTYYANWMFTLGFNSGGYGLPNTDLQPGQSVTFEFTQGSNTQRMEHAYLTKLPDGTQWYRVKWYNLSDKPDTVVFEALFNADRSQVLRMRGKTSGQQAGEIPVEQNTGFAWREPTYLTQQSLTAATVGTETVTTPAGNFSAKHIRYTMMGGGTYEWWTADNVPGGIVKQVVGYQSNMYTQTLVAMANNATTELGSY